MNDSRIRTLLPCLAAALALSASGCREDYEPGIDDDGSTNADQTDLDTTDDDPDMSDAPDVCTAANGEFADECPADKPFCIDSACVPCESVPLDACGNHDPATPACASSGECVQCTDVNESACSGATPVCGDANECVPCTSNDQCATGSCLESGECLLEEIQMTGVVYRYGTIDRVDPRDMAQISVKNIAGIPNPPPTGIDGVYELEGIPPYSLVQLAITAPHDDVGIFVPPSLRTVVSFNLANTSPLEQNLPVVSYGWMAKVAFECGFFPTEQDAIGNGAVNTYFTQRSTVFGTLVTPEGMAVQGISKFGIQVFLDGTFNIHDGIAMTEVNPAKVCFLEKGPDGILHGTTNNFSGAAGAFVMFRIQDEQGTGSGTAIVKAGGFNPSTVKLSSTGEIGIVQLVSNGEAIERDYETEVYPIFTSHGCIGCHAPGGVGFMTAPVRAGFPADWSGTPDEVYDNLTGPGTNCMDPLNASSVAARVCTNMGFTSKSFLLTRPLAEIPDDPNDPHPVDIFASEDDPAATIIRESHRKSRSTSRPRSCRSSAPTAASAATIRARQSLIRFRCAMALWRTGVRTRWACTRTSPGLERPASA